MQTIYDWLLYNTGNEGNYYTILNSQRTTTPEGTDSLTIMARLSDFTSKNLHIHAGQVQAQSLVNTQPERLLFSNEQQVIHYLATGQTADSRVPTDGVVLQVFIREPTGQLGEITFSPEQS